MTSISCRDKLSRQIQQGTLESQRKLSDMDNNDDIDDDKWNQKYLNDNHRRAQWLQTKNRIPLTKQTNRGGNIDRCKLIWILWDAIVKRWKLVVLRRREFVWPFLTVCQSVRNPFHSCQITRNTIKLQIIISLLISFYQDASVVQNTLFSRTGRAVEMSKSRYF